ncbi:hypothetical protein [Pontibacter liquoris]|uniref:hypothetical protein n=1 Tax=Pontibacter liquoris TaxID=2905677 RepID=UPI001FA76F5C|nr:hypothetical protein [Pontibacter liquoris]
MKELIKKEKFKKNAELFWSCRFSAYFCEVAGREFFLHITKKTNDSKSSNGMVVARYAKYREQHCYV